MKYIYIVCRYVKDPNPYVSYPPNLGVFASLKKAKQHYDLVIQDRVKRGDTLYWDIGKSTSYAMPVKDMAHAYLSRKESQGEVLEDLKIERWILFTAKELRRRSK